MNRDAVILSFARFEARKAVKESIRAAGLRVSDWSKAQIDAAANRYVIANRDELCRFVTSHYQSLVERLANPPRRNRRKQAP